ncbi:MAG: N-acetylmuramoyl-L-alanine amidase [Anaerovoracaceae bacterium]
MKKRRKYFSLALTICLLAGLFSFAPGTFAETATTAASAKVNQKFPVIASTTTNGKIQIEKPNADGIVKYTIIPNSGFKITKITINDIKQNKTVLFGKNQGSFTPTTNSTISATFDKCSTYKIKVYSNSKSRGSIKATKTSVVENGKTNKVTVKSVAKSGYYLDQLEVNGKKAIPKTTYTIGNVAKNYTVKATFKKKTKIMIDAGHAGYYNQSPVYSKYYESKMTWKLQNYLKEELEGYGGFTIGTTRKSQSKDRDVYYRGLASEGYDLFLSLHSNSASSSRPDGPLVIPQKRNAVSNTLVRALGSAMENTMDTKDHYTYWTRTNSDGKTEYYGVLRGAAHAGTPGLILEHSFHSNLRAAKWLYSDANLKKMAEAEAKVLADYYDVNGTGDSASKPPTEPVKPPTFTKVATNHKAKVNVSNLSIRKGPSTSYTKMGTAKKGTIYQLMNKTKDGTWGQLKSNGYWICLKGYTTLITPVKVNYNIRSKVSCLTTYKGPDASYDKAGTIKSKTTTYVLKAQTSDGRWGQLATNGYWVSLSSTSVYTKIKATTKSLNMRISPSTKSKSVGKVPSTTKTYELSAISSDGKWGKLKYNNRWIYLAYTKKV